MVEELFAIEIVIHSSRSRISGRHIALTLMAAKDAFCDLDGMHENVDLFNCVVQGETHASRSRQVHLLVERHRAMMARADGHSFAIKQLGKIVRMYTRDAEADDSALLPRCRAEHAHTRDVLESAVGVPCELSLVGQQGVA